MNRPPIHVLAFGDSGSGKSTFAATFPKPALILMFDMYGKEWPYLRRGEARQAEPTKDGTLVTEVYSKKDPGKLLIRIEHYLDESMRDPKAYSRFQTRMSLNPPKPEEWATVVLDSTTFAELAARKWHQYSLNSDSKNPMQWYAGSTDLLEETAMQLATLRTNVVLVTHTEIEKDEIMGSILRRPNLPGKRLHRLVPGAFMEMYRVWVNPQGKRALQTQADALWPAGSQIQAPNGCEPEYQALWANFDKESA